MAAGCGRMPVGYLVGRRRKSEPKGFAWTGYQHLIVTTHRQLAAPLGVVLG